MTPLVTTFAGDSARGEGLFSTTAITPTFDYAYVGVGGNSMKRILLSTFSVAANTVTTVNPSNWFSIDPSATYVYSPSSFATAQIVRASVASWPSSTTLNRSSGALGWTQFCIDPNGTYGYIIASDNPDAAVLKVNLSSFSVSSTLAVIGGLTLGGGAIDQTGTYLYFTQYNNAYLSRVNLSTFSITSTVGTAANPKNIAVRGNDVYVLCINNGIYKYSSMVANGSLVTSGTGQFWGICIDSTGTYAYVIRQGTGANLGTISKIQLSTFTEVAFYTGLDFPYGVAIDSTDTYVYVSNSGAANNVSKFSTSSLSLIGNVTVGSNLTGITIIANGNGQ